MLTPKHLIKKRKNDYRLIAISDIHGHLDRFKELLRKVNYDPVEDYLVIIGDFVEKGDQVLETIHFIMNLSRFPKCYVLMGNCEWAMNALLFQKLQEKFLSISKEIVRTVLLEIFIIMNILVMDMKHL